MSSTSGRVTLKSFIATNLVESVVVVLFKDKTISKMVYDVVVSKEIEEAKEKICGGDYLGARKILLQVKGNVDDICGMIAVCDILFSASLGFMDCDFYFVLQIPPQATTSQIEASYNKFTTLIEPIANANNNFPAAASALRIVQDAYSGLLNPEQRKAFDDKRARKLESSAAEAKSVKHKWSIEEFGPEQVWGIYKGQDFMPRRYVVVNNSFSWNNKVCATLLEPYDPMLDEEISWVQEHNLPLATGLFKRGETPLDLDLSWFSHSVKCDKIMGESESLYKIYPKKGEIWAIYENYFDGTRRPADVKSDQCRIVEIVTDFSQEYGRIRAVSLIEVPGWKSFFQRVQQPDGDHSVSRKEMMFFSHQVPAYTVEGSDSHGIPKGAWHVEPDALPLRITTLQL
ncbi:hypothetical protein COLO4_28948 [Corchorus olitorius]|uniref:J domain-containing protein n=1 Tax=Corchorus olitorius TaxID=93759 RepID=A0A1R3HH76_9ROSI|nr:hypothetical protein COLO4_28948 [Corchorus olitorius]